MEIFLLISIILLDSVRNITQKEYNKRATNGGFLYTSGSALFACLFFIITSFSGLRFTAEILPYSFALALSYTSAVLFSYLAVLNGSVSLSALFLSYSLLLPTMYGLIFLGDPITAPMVIGLGLLVISLFLSNFEKHGEKKKITVKWVIFITLAFLGNGFCTIFQKMQQLKFDGSYKNELMIIALLISVFITLVISLIAERKHFLRNAKRGFLMYSVYGVSNGAVNLLVMILSAKMLTSIMFPAISAGGIILAFLIATMIYKEKHSKAQYVGAALGTAAIVLFNIG